MELYRAARTHVDLVSPVADFEVRVDAELVYVADDRHVRHAVLRSGACGGKERNAVEPRLQLRPLSASVFCSPLEAGVGAFRTYLPSPALVDPVRTPSFLRDSVVRRGMILERERDGESLVHHTPTIRKTDTPNYPTCLLRMRIIYKIRWRRGRQLLSRRVVWC